MGIGRTEKSVKYYMDEIPRKCQMNEWCSAERLIAAAIHEVELLGCDPALTDAVVLLGEAQEKVASFIDREV